MDENDYGSRDQKGHYIPNELNIKNPLWIKPLNIKKIINLQYFSISLHYLRCKPHSFLVA